jgi:hypothetical protein
MTKWIALGAACWIVGCASTGNAPSRTAPQVAAVPAGCVSQTGSWIPQPAGTCAAFGHTYSHSDIETTGRTTIGGALRDLDPTLTISH